MRCQPDDTTAKPIRHPILNPTESATYASQQGWSTRNRVRGKDSVPPTVVPLAGVGAGGAVNLLRYKETPVLKLQVRGTSELIQPLRSENVKEAILQVVQPGTIGSWGVTG